MKSRKNPAKIAAAFTLVELLVTITIIIVIAALSMMGVSRIRESANKAMSMGNLRKLQIANAAYAADHNGYFIGTFAKDENQKTSGTWNTNSEFIDDYVGAVEIPKGGSQEDRIPISSLDPKAYKAGKLSHDKMKASYGSISKGGSGYTSADPNAVSAYSIAELSSPHRTAAFVTALNWLVEYSGRFTWNGEEGKINAPAMAYRYNERVLVSYFDGHVGELTKNDMKTLDSQGGKNNLFWNGTVK